MYILKPLKIVPGNMGDEFLIQFSSLINFFKYIWCKQAFEFQKHNYYNALGKFKLTPHETSLGYENVPDK